MSTGTPAGAVTVVVASRVKWRAFALSVVDPLPPLGAGRGLCLRSRLGAGDALSAVNEGTAGAVPVGF